MDKAPLIVWLAKEDPTFFTLAGHTEDNLRELSVTLSYAYILNSEECIRYFGKLLMTHLPCKWNSDHIILGGGWQGERSI